MHQRSLGAHSTPTTAPSPQPLVSAPVAGGDQGRNSMESSQDTIDLARIRNEIAAGLINISNQSTQLDRVIARGEETSAERRELWRIEMVQAGLGRKQSQLVDRMAHAARPAVVLVVEDEILVLMSAIADLEAAGFVVLEASSADEALAARE